MPIFFESSHRSKQQQQQQVNDSFSGSLTIPSMPFSRLRSNLRAKMTAETSASSSRSTRKSSISSAPLAPAMDLPPAYSKAEPSLPPSSASFTPHTLPGYTPRDTNYSPPIATPCITTDVSGDDPFAFLRTFDTVFLVDDSGSMAGRSWRDTGAALAAIAPICTSHDSDGIDLHFLNHRFDHAAQHTHLRTPTAVAAAFIAVRPYGGTPTGARLASLLTPYLARCQAHGCAVVRPLSVIVVTDGAAADDVESVLIAAARRLDEMAAPAWQVGVQFVQVGQEAGAAEALRDLDDGLAEVGGVRDMVDTVPWSEAGGDGGLSSERLMKVVLGAVVRRLDRKRASVELARESATTVRVRVRAKARARAGAGAR